MEDRMSVKLSPEYQIVIPREVREPMGLRPGAEFNVFGHGDRIELVPVRDIRELRGLLKGTDARIERDDEDRV